MDERQLLRYSRHLLLPQIDIGGQERLFQARVLIVGVGGLGCPAAIYLAASGVGELVLADPDRVELSNLQRQIAHTSGDLGLPKVEAAAKTLKRLNPEIKLRLLQERLLGNRLLEESERADLVLDCSDNFETRFAVNRASVESRTPLVSGAAIRFEGQVSVFDPRRPESPCYHCLFPEEGELEERCAEAGILAPVVGLIGTLQAVEAIKVLLDIGKPLTGRLLLYDGLEATFRTVTIPKNPRCPVCG